MAEGGWMVREYMNMVEVVAMVGRRVRSHDLCVEPTGYQWS